MGGDPLQRFLVVVVHLELGDLLLLVGRHPRVEHPLFPGQAPHQGAGIRIVGQPLGQDVPGPLQGSSRIRHPLVRIDKRQGSILRRPDGQRLGRHQVGQRLQSPFPGNGGLGAPLGLVGEVEVLQLGLLARGLDPLPQLRGQLALFLDGLEDRQLALLKFAEIGKTLFNGADLDLIQLIGALLAVAGDKGDGGPLLQEFHGVCDLCRVREVSAMIA